MGQSTTPSLPATQLAALAAHPQALANPGHGIEKESLRVDANGGLSAHRHPIGLGSALTHPNITTDFSESQLELIAGVHSDPADCVAQLHDVHAFVHETLRAGDTADEVLWPSSMPCILGDAADIPLGQYGSSNIAQAKTTYRRGLAHRYGALMQTISGIHYNFSVPAEFWALRLKELGSQDGSQTSLQQLRTQGYFDLIRNFRRYSWLLIYLFGASPAVCKSFVKHLSHELESFDEGTMHRPYGTSLRMGRLGYQSDAQADLHVSYNSLEDFAATMRRALSESYPPYEAIGLEVDGVFQQLNTSLIQIENEFYGTIRPKQPVRSGERPLTALNERGVEYVEVRCMDLNPFLPIGIDVETCRFLDTFLIYCLLAPSPRDSEEESARMYRNQLSVVEQGRRPDLTLEGPDGPLPFTAWAQELLDGCDQVATLLDGIHKTDAYTAAASSARAKVADPELTPSARVLSALRNERIPFFRFAMNQALEHRQYFDAHPLSAETRRAFTAASATSLDKQRAIEAADTVSFAEFLADYIRLPNP